MRARVGRQQAGGRTHATAASRSADRPPPRSRGCGAAVPNPGLPRDGDDADSALPDFIMGSGHPDHHPARHRKGRTITPMLHSSSIRIYAIVVLALLLSLALASFLMLREVEIAYDMREAELGAPSDAAINQLADLDRQVAEGTLSLEAARDMGRQTLSTCRFGRDGYFVAFDDDPVFQAHPFRPDWIGADQSGFRVVKGLMLFQEMHRIAKRDGAGRIDYWFNKPGTDIPEMKMGHVAAFAPWGWMIGSGAYVSDIQADLAAKRNTALAALAVGLLFLAATSYFLARSSTAPLATTLGAMNDVANGRYTTVIEVESRRDEFGVLGRSLSAFRDKLAAAEAADAERERSRAEQAVAVERLGRGLTALSSGDLTHRLDEAFAP
ncbi:cache domain-containing protein, partial [Rhodovulum sp.]|uniref:cache domain-containing protein n=1 Tax=Rhodovulum sp. TaxID=34009 RepID=UPI001802899B